MSIADRFARLGGREQRLLNGALLGFGVLLVVVLPIALSALVHTRRSANDALRDAGDSIVDSHDAIEKNKQEKAATAVRYARPAPPMAAFLAGLASEAGVEIPESQDRQAVPHGKKYVERQTKLALHRVGMLKILKFTERIEQSGHPVTISSLNIRKRGPDPDMYDVEMIVSAFDRNATVEKPKPAPDASATEGEAKP